MKNNVTFLMLSLFAFSSCQMFQRTAETTQKDENDKTEEVVVEEKSKKASHVNFVSAESFEAVLEKSAKENKPIFVDFYADWCGPCKLMDKKVFTDQKFATYLNDNFINYKVDADEWAGVQLSSKYEVRVLPTLLFLDANGEVLSRKKGAAFQTELRDLGNQAIEAFADRSEN